ncbi:MFS transporter [Saccharopolyspora sp. NPDC050389]|uniref:MFS transporter n=1 Tax=Saccharopolyspora sp. NPDC050389 TaxID=3155516 RepID=UPI0034006AD4
MPLALLALAISAFGIGTTEFITNRLLPDLAAAFGVSIPTAGLLTSGYALAPTYGVLMAGRVVSALAHGAFFGVGSVVAAGLVDARKKASAIALMFTGLTLANVLGMPMGTLLGQQFGWRSAFWGVTALGVVGLIGIAALVPHQPAEPGSGLRGELAAFRRPQVWLALAVTAIGFSGLLTSFTYVAPMLTDVAGFSPASIAWLLAIYGAGLVVGTYLGGKAADRALLPTIFTLLAALAAVLALFPATLHHPVAAVVALFVLGAVGFGTIPPLQMRVMQLAGGAATLVSAANITAFNLGAAAGAWLGGLAIDAGFGYASPNWVGAGLTAAGLVLAIATADLRRTNRRPASADRAPAHH